MSLQRLFLVVSAAVFAAALGVLLAGLQPPVVQVERPGPDAPLSHPFDLPPARSPRPPLDMRLADQGFAKGDAVFVRIFKQEGQLEVWLRKGERFELFDIYTICAFSGGLGPKLREGDGQSPEGFYEVGRKQLNPNSAYHLAFNLGYPNAFDRANGRTGSFLMVHGACASIGCYAMTDAHITEIYRLVAAALNRGQASVPVHVFPFRMSDAAMASYAGDARLPFWRDLKEGYDLFESTGVPPDAFVCGQRYGFGGPGAGCARIAAW
jgi:murein L,D-transpeptidase YafK